MILTCPECGTQYVVKDGAIPPEGRQVRCAACKHSWHQGPDETPQFAEDEQVDVDAPPAEVVAETDAEPVIGDADVHATDFDAADTAEAAAEDYAAFDPVAVGGMPAPEISDAPPAAADEVADVAPDIAPEPADDFSPFADRSVTIEPQQNRVMPIVIAVLVIAALAAAFWFLAPQQWRARVGLADAGSTPLQLMMTHSDRQRLESGNELLAVTGRVINPTDEAQTVPPIQAQLRSTSGELVYSWTIAPPARTLPPGASATFNSAEVNVPAGGDELTISLGNPPA